MKILQVSPRYPPQSGGVETHVQNLSERFVENGHQVTVLTADAGNEGNRRECRNGVRIQRYRSLAPNDAIHVCPQIAVAVRRIEADVVHAHNYHSFPLFFAALGVDSEPFVVTTHYHGSSASSIRDLLLSAYHSFGRWAVRQADEVIAVSEWERQQLNEDFEVDATVITNGIDVDRFVDAAPIDHHRPYLLTVGRLEEYKGVHHVIRALSALPEYDLLVAGSGPYRETLARIAREERVADQVEFLGYVDAERLPRLYAGAEAYVTMSEFEAYGMTVAEALAAGTPCIVREKTALRDWVSKNGVIGVSAPSETAIRQAVRNIDGSQIPSLQSNSWSDVTDRILQEVYPTERRP